MKLLPLLFLALTLASSAAEARHYRHSHAHHASIPLPKPRPVIRLERAPEPQAGTVYTALYEYGIRQLSGDKYVREFLRR